MTAPPVNAVYAHFTFSGGFRCSSMSGKRNVDRRSNASSPADISESRRGSASSTPIDTTKPQIDFQFLNFSHPSEAKTGKTRKAVRSHVTKQQHKQENAAAAARRARSQQGYEGASSSQVSSASTPSEQFLSADVLAQSSISSADASEPSSPSLSPSMSPTYSPQRRLDPAEVYPEEWHPYIGRIMEHYFQNLAVDIPELDGPQESGLLRSRFFPFIMTDAASLHAVMLVAASHYGRARGSRSHAIDLLQLRGLAIREINRALEDPVRARSDQLIAAVAKMAAYEALFGDVQIYNTHMTGLLRLVSLRGGLPALGLDGLLERILLWIDSNAAHATNSHIYFDKAAFPTTAVHPRPDPVRFSGGLI